MKNETFIHKNVEEYVSYISDVKNLSKNTASSYKRDLDKLANFVIDLEITEYSSINDEICSAWIGDLFSNGINPRSIQRHLSSAKGFFKFLKKKWVSKCVSV